MKPTTVLVFACLAFAEVFAGSLFGEKETAIGEITELLKKVETYANEVKTEAKNQANKNDQELISRTKKDLEKIKNEYTDSLKQEFIKTGITAIEKGKSLPVFDCILKAYYEGKKQFDETYSSFEKKVDDIVNQRNQGLKFAEEEIDLIKTATNATTTASIESIIKAILGIQNLKNEALKKLDSAKKCLEEVDSRIKKPFINNECENLKTQFKTKNEDIKKSSFNNLKKCVA